MQPPAPATPAAARAPAPADPPTVADGAAAPAKRRGRPRKAAGDAPPDGQQQQAAEAQLPPAAELPLVPGLRQPECARFGGQQARRAWGLLQGRSCRDMMSPPFSGKHAVKVRAQSLRGNNNGRLGLAC